MYYDITITNVDVFDDRCTIICKISTYGIILHLSYVVIYSVCNLSDYPTKVGFRIFCRISSDYEEYARSLSNFNICDHITLKQS